MFYYNDSKGVSAEHLALSNFVVGLLIIYISIAVGNLSDRIKGRFRRKPFVAFFAPLYALGTFLKFGAFANDDSAAVYYVVTYAIQVTGNCGLGIANDAWNVELANDEVDRGKLYASNAALGVLGLMIGLGLLSTPLLIAAPLLSVCVLGLNILNLSLVHEGTPLSKRY
jgi:Na+/melibiose symporter-like transporter